MHPLTPPLAILSITTLSALAILHSINGALFMASVSIIAGLGGYIIRGEIEKRNGT